MARWGCWWEEWRRLEIAVGEGVGGGGVGFFFSSRRGHTRCSRDWSSDVCSSDLDRPRLGHPLSQRATSVTLVLDARQVAAIRRHGEADYPAEACGLIGGAVEGDRKVAVQLVPLVNQRTDSARNRHLIDPESFRRAQE